MTQNRKLIRAEFSAKDPMKESPKPQAKTARPPRGSGKPSPPRPKRSVPPEMTHAENFYYLKQMNAKTPMVVVLEDGERLEGWIEWYDRSSIKLNRPIEPNLLIMKRCIKYMHKDEGDSDEE